MTAIVAKNIFKKYVKGDETIVLFENISFNIEKGEFIYVHGDCKSGRSTLLKMLSAITPPNRGTIEVFGQDILSLKHRTNWRINNIGFLTNEQYIVPYLTAEQHLLMGSNGDEKDDEKLPFGVKEILCSLKMDENKLKRPADELSLLDRITITLARVLQTNPRLLLLDDFARSLPPYSKLILYDRLTTYARRKKITIISAGDEEFAEFTDRVLKLANHKIHEVNHLY